MIQIWNFVMKLEIVETIYRDDKREMLRKKFRDIFNEITHRIPKVKNLVV